MALPVVAEFFLVVKRSGSWEVKKTDRFVLGPNEVATKVRIKVPVEAFLPRPTPTVEIEVDQNMTYRNVEITGETAE